MSTPRFAASWQAVNICETRSYNLGEILITINTRRHRKLLKIDRLLLSMPDTTSMMPAVITIMSKMLKGLCKYLDKVRPPILANISNVNNTVKTMFAFSWYWVSSFGWL